MIGPDFGLVAYVQGDDVAVSALAQRLEAVGLEVRTERRHSQRRVRTSGRGDSVERRRPPVLRGSFVLQVRG